MFVKYFVKSKWVGKDVLLGYYWLKKAVCFVTINCVQYAGAKWLILFNYLQPVHIHQVIVFLIELCTRL